MIKDWKNKRITILGLSISGCAAAKYLASQGALVTISEKRDANDSDVEKIKSLEVLGIKVEMGSHNEDTIKNSELVITSPGIPPRVSVFELIRQNNIKIISEIDLAFLETNKPFVCITGTNGKTTTTKLVSEIFTKAGKNAPACGNIGTPPTALIEKNPDYFVTEISSYQLEYSQYLKPYIACFLNYTPDHLDWHGSEEMYLQAKLSLFIGENAPEYAVLNANDSNVMKLIGTTPSKVFVFGQEIEENCIFIENDSIFYKEVDKEEIIKLSDIKVFGNHNYENIMAAIAIVKIAGLNNSAIKKAIAEFNPPEHRLEYVDCIEGIKYYNDSKATNCDAAICALNAFGKPVVLIAGGRDKGTDLSEFVNTVTQKASAVVLIGEATQRFANALGESGYDKIYKAGSLEESIEIASRLKQGDVLFAPACSSFDMFKNFEERGIAFKGYVNKKKHST